MVAAAGFSAFSAFAAAGFAALAGFSACSAFGAFGSLAIDHFSRALREAHLLTVLLGAETDAGRLAVLRIDDGQIRQVNRRFLGDDAALLRLALFLVTADLVDAAHERLVFRWPHLQH